MLKKTVATFLTVLALFTVPFGVTALTGEPIFGDVDLSGSLNVKDATLVQKYVAKLSTLDEIQVSLADYNNDKAVNVKDATTIQKICAGIDVLLPTTSPTETNLSTTPATLNTEISTCPTTQTCQDGKSAYEIAVGNGFVGTEEEWLLSLSQGNPIFVQSIDACTDKNKLYLLPDGFIYAYITKEVFPDVVIEELPGSYYISSGEILKEVSMSCKRTNQLPVSPGDRLRYTGRGLWSAVSVLWYDEDDEVIDSAVYNENNEVTTVEVTAPANACRVIFTSYCASTHIENVVLDVAWLECKNALTTDWHNTGIKYTQDPEEEKYSSLKGLKIVYDGDSICESRDDNGGGYAKIISDITDSKYVNYAKGGARLISLKEGEKYHSIVDNLENLPKDGDLYCFDGGVNDYWTYGVLGDFDPNDYTGEVDETTVCGALESIFRYSLDNFDAPICFVISHKVKNIAYTENAMGDTFADYREKMIGICEKYSIPYYDAFSRSGLNGWNETQNNLYLTGNPTATPDGSHPNELGYQKFYVPQLISLFESIMPNN